MPIKRKKQADIDAIKRALKPRFKNVRVYRYNSASIRIRVIDPCFLDLGPAQREELVLPLLADLPDEVQSDITMLLLVTAEESKRSLLNIEFENPAKSSL